MAENTYYNVWNEGKAPNGKAARVERNPMVLMALLNGMDIPEGCFFSFADGIIYTGSSAENYKPLTPEARAEILSDVERAVEAANEFLKPENRRCVKKGRE